MTFVMAAWMDQLDRRVFLIPAVPPTPAFLGLDSLYFRR